MTLQSLFNPRSNSLNAIRLILATMVIVSHSWPIQGLGVDPNSGGQSLGGWAVFGFFGLSGYLITRSRMSGQPAWQYYVARFLRIYPGFLACILVTAFVFAPLAVRLGSGGTYTITEGIKYVWGSLLLHPPVIGHPWIGTTLASAPFPDVWNGSLWTLFWEAACYVLIGIAVSIFRSKTILGPIMIATFILGTAVSYFAQVQILVLPGFLVGVVPMTTAFVAGSILFLYADKIQVVPMVSASVVILIGLTFTKLAVVFAALPLAMLLMTLGSVINWQRIGSKNDISYGVYIYAFPVQQLLVVAFPPGTIPHGVHILLAIMIVYPLAWMSYRLVEKPALNLKPRRRSANTVDQPVGAAV